MWQKKVGFPKYALKKLQTSCKCNPGLVSILRTASVLDFYFSDETPRGELLKVYAIKVYSWARLGIRICINL